MKTRALAKRPIASRSIVVSSMGKAASALQPVSGLEDPPYNRQADRQKHKGHGQAHGDAHVRNAEEAPAKAADEINHGIEQRHLLPERRQHMNRVERAAEEGERRDDQQRHDLQALEAVSPDAEHEAEQPEGDGRKHEKGEHEQRMLDAERYEEAGSGENDQTDDDRLGGRGADIADDDLEIGDRRGQDFVDSSGKARE